MTSENYLQSLYPMTYVPQRDPRYTDFVIDDIRSEIDKRMSEGTTLHGNSLEAEVYYFVRNWPGLQRNNLLEVAAMLVETIALYDLKTKEKATS